MATSLLVVTRAQQSSSFNHTKARERLWWLNKATHLGHTGSHSQTFLLAEGQWSKIDQALDSIPGGSFLVSLGWGTTKGVGVYLSKPIASIKLARYHFFGKMRKLLRRVRAFASCISVYKNKPLTPRRPYVETKNTYQPSGVCTECTFSFSSSYRLLYIYIYIYIYRTRIHMAPVVSPPLWSTYIYRDIYIYIHRDSQYDRATK